MVKAAVCFGPQGYFLNTAGACWSGRGEQQAFVAGRGAKCVYTCGFKKGTGAQMRR